MPREPDRGSNGTPMPTPTPPTLPAPNNIPGVIPPGYCTDLLNTAYSNLDSVASQVIPVYKDAARQAGIPWEYLAAIHYVETGGHFYPTSSLIDGTPLGGKTLLESALAAASTFKQKEYMVNYVARQNGMPTPVGFYMLMGQFAAYNSTTQGECAMDKTTFKYTGTTWTDIPDNGQCKNQRGTNTLGEGMVGDRHVYATSCLDTSHQDMYIHFHSNDQVRLYKDRVGALAIVRDMPQKYRDQEPTPPSNPNFLRAPTDSEIISNEVIASCQRNDAISYDDMDRCEPQLRTVTSRFTSIAGARYSSIHYLQCTQFAVGLANEINGTIPRIHNACMMRNQPTDGNYIFIPKTGSSPLPGDLIIWNSPDLTHQHPEGICNSQAVGHIAYVSEVPNMSSVLVAEANINHKGKVAYRIRAITQNVIGWLRKK